MKFFGYWTVFVALSIGIVAAYYSIVGLVAIFAAAAVPVIIMGSVLEVGKLTTAVWLHLNWRHAGFLIKTYLISATALLMFITSMGIFGFLSKAHIEQTAVATEGAAQLERIETEITRNENIIERAESRIVGLENSGSDNIASIQEQIDREQARIDSAYQAIQPSIEDQQDIVQRERNNQETTLAPYRAELAEIEEKLNLIVEYIANDDIRRLQGLIGARQDGQYGSQTAARVEQFRNELNSRRQELVDIIGEIQSAENTAIQAAQAEISRLRGIAERQITDGNELINRLRSQMGTVDNSSVDQQIAEQREVIRVANSELDQLFETKYAIETEARKLEAEVGPVKYIAELIYGEQTDRNTLEEAVRWVILIIVVVFDPLAVVLVISGISLIEQHSRRISEPEPFEETPSSDQDKKLFTEAELAEYIQEAIEIIKQEDDSEKENLPSINTLDDKQEVIVYQGVEYEPSHYDYKRIREQLELNNRLRNERGIVKNPVDKEQQ
jgi:hypothetical protein